LEGNYHIGASGLIYVLVSFIFFKVTDKILPFDRAVVAVILYGGIFMVCFPKWMIPFLRRHLAGFNTDAFFLYL
jgi:hypothetical protein